MVNRLGVKPPWVNNLFLGLSALLVAITVMLFIAELYVLSAIGCAITLAIFMVALIPRPIPSLICLGILCAGGGLSVIYVLYAPLFLGTAGVISVIVWMISSAGPRKVNMY